jgi:two-component system chemotaxis response regulator CheY
MLSVLVVDDMRTSRGLIIQALEAIGIKNYSWEADANSALKTLQNNPVNLIISDQNMPGGTGLQLLQAVRAYKPTAQTGFILITGSPDPRVLQKGVELGLNNFLKKPFTEPQLKQCIETVVGKL